MSDPENVGVLIATMVKEFARPILSGASSMGKEALDKLKVALEVSFEKYLVRGYERYSKTKTLLYRDQPVKLRDFYVKTDLSLGNKNIQASEFLGEVFEKRKVVVSGTAGSGKSTFCKSLFLDVVEGDGGVVPLFVELRHLNSQDDSGVVSFLIKTLAEIEPSFNIGQLDYALRLGRVLLILDGYDELLVEERDKFYEEVLKLSNKYEKLMVVVSSRPDQCFDSWEEFYHYRVQPLDKEKAKSLINKLEYDRAVKRKFLTDLDNSLYEKHKSFASTPLLLTMMLMTYEQIAEIPNKIHLFYEQAFLTLFNKHDSLKSLYKRQSMSKLALDDFKKLLSAFSLVSYVDAKFYFDGDEDVGVYVKKAIGLCGLKTKPDDFLYDLVNNLCILQRDGLGYAFSHRSFQEYFTALFLVGYSGANKYGLIDRVAFINHRNDVIPMICEINGDLFEREWFLPKLKSFVELLESFPKTAEGGIDMLKSLYDSVDAKKSGDRYIARLGISSSRADANKAYFITVIHRLYMDDVKKYYSRHKVMNQGLDIFQEALKEIADNDHGAGYVDLDDDLSDRHRELILQAGYVDRLRVQIAFMKSKIKSLEKKYQKKQADISSLILGC